MGDAVCVLFALRLVAEELGPLLIKVDEILGEFASLGFVLYDEMSISMGSVISTGTYRLQERHPGPSSKDVRKLPCCVAPP